MRGPIAPLSAEATPQLLAPAPADRDVDDEAMVPIAAPARRESGGQLPRDKDADRGRKIPA